MSERAERGQALKAIEKDADVSLWQVCGRVRDEVERLRFEICRLALAVEAGKDGREPPIENAAAMLEDAVTLLIRAKALLDALESGLAAVAEADSPIDPHGH